MLHGGIPTGQACLIIGSSGTGKTLLALHFLVSGAARGDPCVMVTFEEQPQVHIQKARSFGWVSGGAGTTEPAAHALPAAGGPLGG